MKELITIQSRLKAPKGQINQHMHFNYRSCEDILTAVKPLLMETGCTLTISDDVVMVGNRIYVKATATLTSEKGETVQVTAYARETEAKNGMDSAQITGAASSYARKYALNGLFAIDDTKDPDTYEDKPKRKNTQLTQQQPAQQTQGDGELTPKEILEFYAKPAIEQATDKAQLKKIYDDFGALQGYEPFKAELTKRKKELNA